MNKPTYSSEKKEGLFTSNRGSIGNKQSLCLR